MTSSENNPDVNECSYWYEEIPHQPLLAGYWSGFQADNGSGPTSLSIPLSSLQRLTRTEYFWKYRLPWLVYASEKQNGIANNQTSKSPISEKRYDPVNDQRELKVIYRLIKENFQLEKLQIRNDTLEKERDSYTHEYASFVDICAIVYGEDSEMFYRCLAWFVRDMSMDPCRTDYFGISILDRLSRFWNMSCRPGTLAVVRLFEACIYSTLQYHFTRIPALCSVIVDKAEDLKDKIRHIRSCEEKRTDSSSSVSNRTSEQLALEEEANMYRRIVFRISQYVGQNTQSMQGEEIHRMSIEKLLDVLKYLMNICDQICPSKHSRFELIRPSSEPNKSKDRFGPFSSMFSFVQVEFAALSEVTYSCKTEGLYKSLLKYFIDLRCDNWHSALGNFKNELLCDKSGPEEIWTKIKKVCLAICTALKHKVLCYPYILPRCGRSMSSQDGDVELAVETTDDFLWFAACFAGKISTTQGEPNPVLARRCMFFLVNLIFRFDFSLANKDISFKRLNKPLLGSSLIVAAARWDLSMDLSNITPSGKHLMFWGDFLNLIVRYENWPWSRELNTCSDEPGSETLSSVCRKGTFDLKIVPQDEKTNKAWSQIQEAFSLPSETGSKDMIKIASKRILNLLFPDIKDPNFKRLKESKGYLGAVFILLSKAILPLGQILKTTEQWSGRVMCQNFVAASTGYEDPYKHGDTETILRYGPLSIRQTAIGVSLAFDTRRRDGLPCDRRTELNNAYQVFPDIRDTSPGTKPFLPLANDENELSKPVEKLTDILGNRLPGFLMFVENEFGNKYGDALITRNLYSKKKIYDKKLGFASYLPGEASGLETSLKMLLNLSGKRRTKCSLSSKLNPEVASAPLLSAVVVAMDSLCNSAPLSMARHFVRSNADSIREAYLHSRAHEAVDLADPVHSFNLHVAKVNKPSVDAAAKILFVFLTHNEASGSISSVENARDEDLQNISKTMPKVVSPSLGAMKGMLKDLADHLPEYYREREQDDSYDAFAPLRVSREGYKRNRNDETMHKSEVPDYTQETERWPRDWSRIHKMDAIFRAMTNGLCGSVPGENEDVVQAGYDVELGEGKENYDRATWWNLASRKRIVRLFYLVQCFGKMTLLERRSLDEAFDDVFLTKKTREKGSFGFCGRLASMCALYSGTSKIRKVKGSYGYEISPLDDNHIVYHIVQKAAEVSCSVNSLGRQTNIHDPRRKELRQVPLAVRWSFWTMVLDLINDLCDVYQPMIIIFGNVIFFDHLNILEDLSTDYKGSSMFACTPKELKFLIYPSGESLKSRNTIKNDCYNDEEEDESAHTLFWKNDTNQTESSLKLESEDIPSIQETLKDHVFKKVKEVVDQTNKKKRFGKYKPSGNTIGSTLLSKRLYRFKPKIFEDCRPISNSDLTPGVMILQTTAPLPLGYWGNIFRFAKLKFLRKFLIKIRPRIGDDNLSLAFWLTHIASYDPYIGSRDFTDPKTFELDLIEEDEDEREAIIRANLINLFGNDDDDDDSENDDAEEDEIEQETPITVVSQIQEPELVVPIDDDHDDDTVYTDEDEENDQSSGDEDDDDDEINDEDPMNIEQTNNDQEHIQHSESTQSLANEENPNLENEKRKITERVHLKQVEKLLEVVLMPYTEEVLDYSSICEKSKSAFLAFETLAINPIANVDYPLCLADLCAMLMPSKFRTETKNAKSSWLRQVPSIYLLQTWSYALAASLDDFGRDSSRLLPFFEDISRSLDSNDEQTRLAFLEKACSRLEDRGVFNKESISLISFWIDLCSTNSKQVKAFLIPSVMDKPINDNFGLVCPFCQDNIAEGHRVSVYQCGHAVHTTCWIRSLVLNHKKKPDSMDVFACPYKDRKHIDPKALCRLSIDFEHTKNLKQ